MADKEKKGNNLLIILLIVVIVVVLGSAGTVTYFLVFKSKVTTTTAAPAKVAEKTVALDEFVANLADQGSRTYIKVKIVLAYTDKGVDTEITENTSQIRDAVNTFLLKKTSDDFNAKNIVKTKKDLIDSINTELPTGKISNIYFQDILIQ